MEYPKISIADLRVNERNPRVHPKKQVRDLARSIDSSRYFSPILIDEQNRIIAGHGRYEAAKLLGWTEVPIIRIFGLSEARKRALTLADNRIAEGAGWDRKQLALEFPELTELLQAEDLDISITGFEPPEIDQILIDFENDTSDPGDEPDPAWDSDRVVSRQGDLWRLGDHYLLCGDARDGSAIQRLMGQRKAAMVFTEARRTGLLPQDRVSSDASRIHVWLREAAEPKPMNLDIVDDPSADLEQLEERRRRLRGELQEVRDEVAEVERANKEASEFEIEAREQEARLLSIGLIPTQTSATDVCPVCESHLAVPVPTVDEIRASLSGIGTQLASVRRDSPRLQERLATLEARRAELEEQLRVVQRQVAQRIADNERMRVQQNQFAEQARVAGRIAYYLETATSIAPQSDLNQTINRLRAELAELEKVLDDDSLESRLDTALNLVGQELTAYARELGLEHSNNLLRLDRKQLTVIADTVDGPLALAQIGSGENWVGYHVAAHLSLHKLFRRRNRPVWTSILPPCPTM